MKGADLEISLLGAVAIWDRNRVSCQLTSTQAAVVLARLVLDRNRGVSRHELADTVWPNELPANWGSWLRSLVSRVRSFAASALQSEGRNPVVAEAGRYWFLLPAGTWVDIEWAELAIANTKQASARGDLTTARKMAMDGVDRLRSPFLPDHDGEWVTGVQERLAELLLNGLENASQVYTVDGDAVSAVTLANEAIQRAPFRESSHRRLMDAQAAAGNRMEALRAYQRLRRTLIEDGGINPAPETEAAYLRLLGAATASATPGPSSQPTHSVDNLENKLSSFVGRERAMAILHNAWSKASTGSSQMVLLTGESGIGKTRLAMEAGRRIANEGGLVLFGRCDRETLAPYQAIAEALDNYIAAYPDEELPYMSRSSWATAATILPSLTCDGVCEDPLYRPHLFATMTRLVVSISRHQPTVMLLDNMQWADPNTMLLLRHFLRHSVDAQILVVAISRDDMRAPHPLLDLDRDVEWFGSVERVRLGGLRNEDLRSLLHSEVASSVDCGRSMTTVLSDETSGNPMMSIAILRTFSSSVITELDIRTSAIPDRIHDLLAYRLAPLNEATAVFLQVAAAVGDTFSFDTVRVGAGMDSTTGLDALDEALQAGFVVAAESWSSDSTTIGGSYYTFAKKLDRRTLYSQLSNARRDYLESRVAHIL